MRGASQATASEQLPLHEVERLHITRTLERLGGNRARAAGTSVVNVEGMM